jgi:hypothetical protein
MVCDTQVSESRKIQTPNLSLSSDHSFRSKKEGISYHHYSPVLNKMKPVTSNWLCYELSAIGKLSCASRSGLGWGAYCSENNDVGEESLRGNSRIAFGLGD